MKTFEIRVTQPLIGYYYGWMTFEAQDADDAIHKITQMTTAEIDESVHWEIGDEMEADGDEIEIHLDTLLEL